MYEAGGSKELMRVLKDYHEYVGRVRKVTLGETKRAKTPLTSINRYARQLRIMTHCWQKMRQRAYKQFKEKYGTPWLGKPY